MKKLVLSIVLAAVLVSLLAPVAFALGQGVPFYVGDRDSTRYPSDV